jgi:hypothetical protein
MNSTDQITARVMFRLWDKAIDAKAKLANTPHSNRVQHAWNRRWYLIRENDVVNATGLDRETVREVTDYAAGITSQVPVEWVAA